MSFTLVVQGARVLFIASSAIQSVKNGLAALIHPLIPMRYQYSHVYEKAQERQAKIYIEKNKISPKEEDLEMMVEQDHRYQQTVYAGKAVLFAYGAASLATGQYLPGYGAACALAGLDMAHDLSQLICKPKQ